MKKIALAAAAVLTITAFAAPAAQAYDREAFAYAAGHMLEPSKVPASIGLRDTLDFNGSSSGEIYICRTGDRDVRITPSTNSFVAGYRTKKNVNGGLTISVNQFASSPKAIAAFGELKKALTTCEGPSSGAQTFGDGSTDTWSRLNTTGNVPAVTITGVPSLYFNVNYSDVTSGTMGSEYSSDTYFVYTLVNDVIITTMYYTGSELNLPTKKRKVINQIAFDAVTAWLG